MISTDSDHVPDEVWLSYFTGETWTKKPPLDHPPARDGFVWVLLDATPPAEPDEVWSNRIVGVFTSRRAAFRGLIGDFIDWDGYPLAALHRLTWNVNPLGHIVECWWNDVWDKPEEGRRFRFELERLR